MKIMKKRRIDIKARIKHCLFRLPFKYVILNAVKMTILIKSYENI